MEKKEDESGGGGGGDGEWGERRWGRGEGGWEEEEEKEQQQRWQQQWQPHQQQQRTYSNSSNVTYSFITIGHIHGRIIVEYAHTSIWLCMISYRYWRALCNVCTELNYDGLLAYEYALMQAIQILCSRLLPVDNLVCGNSPALVDASH